jgi:putative redox protein
MVDMAKATVESQQNLRQEVRIRHHRLAGDEAPEIGGEDTAPTPHEFLLAALGTCTSMTLLVYSRRKSIPLEKVVVELEDTREGAVTQIRRDIHLEGPLSEEQRQRLLEIAAKCPVHRTLTGEIRVADRLV